MDLDLTDKVAVVTGANEGIGLAITEALAAEGALVVAGSRSTDNLERFLQRCVAGLSHQVSGDSEPFLEVWSHTDDVAILGAKARERPLLGPA
jgi:NAD(P)-dependent dehydrogenase (short-subunit alcohol dehydrogenase family)